MRISDWSSDVCSSDLGYRTLFTAPEATYPEMIKAMKENRMAAVRHDQVSGNKTRMLGGTKAFRENVMAHEDQWKWWSSTDSGAHTVNSVPWAALTDRKSTRLNSSH